MKSMANGIFKTKILVLSVVNDQVQSNINIVLVKCISLCSVNILERCKIE